MTRDEIIQRRRTLSLPGYSTLESVGFDGSWVTPYQIASCSPNGPVLVAYNWLDEPSVHKHREVLRALGYLPGITFNKVLDRALEIRGMARSHLYMTQAFHLLPPTRSFSIRPAHIDKSFDTVTRYELTDRKVIALGGMAAGACRRHGVKHIETMHPSARGLTIEDKAQRLAVHF